MSIPAELSPITSWVVFLSVNSLAWIIKRESRVASDVCFTLPKVRLARSTNSSSLVVPFSAKISSRDSDCC